MELAIRYLRATDTAQASYIDATWYGDRGISKAELDEFISRAPDHAIAVVHDEVVYGFATFEVVEAGSMPSSYTSTGMPLEGRVLFIQQFTTTQNYSGDKSVDIMLLDAVEVMAKKINCVVVAEALDSNHAYKKENNPEHDAFGFYQSRGYSIDTEHHWEWTSYDFPPVSCVLVYKNVETRV